MVLCFMARRIFSIMGERAAPANLSSKALTVSNVRSSNTVEPMSSARAMARAIPSPLPKKGPLAFRAFTVKRTVPQPF